MTYDEWRAEVIRQLEELDEADRAEQRYWRDLFDQGSAPTEAVEKYLSDLGAP